jgi:hypothetical protein
MTLASGLASRTACAMRGVGQVGEGFSASLDLHLERRPRLASRGVQFRLSVTQDNGSMGFLPVLERS